MAPAVPATRPCPRPRPFGAGAVLKGATATLAYAAHQQFDRTYLPPNVGRPFSPLVPDPALQPRLEGAGDCWLKHPICRSLAGLNKRATPPGVAVCCADLA